MPNVTMSGQADLDVLVPALVPTLLKRRHAELDVVINLIRAFRQSDEPHWLIEAMVQEGRLRQQIGLLLVVDTDGKIILKTAEMGSPRATWGVKEAVRALAGLLIDRQPALRVLSSTVGPPDASGPS